MAGRRRGWRGGCGGGCGFLSGGPERAGAALVFPGLLWRAGGEAGEGLAAALADFGREAGGGPLVAVGLADVPGAEEALVADAEEAGQPQRERGYAREAAPAAGDA